MGFENNFGFNPAKKEKLKTGEERKEAEVTRREFLRGLAGVAGVAVAGSAAIKGLEFFVDKFGDKEGAVEEKIADEPTREQAEIENEDMISSEEVLNFKNEGPIEFNLKTVEAIKNNWKERYRDNPKLKNSFIRAYREIGNWQPYLEKIFAEKGVPREFIFLAIPESHWQPGAVSRVGAAGPYQFMPKTAKLYGLKVSAEYDERKDPLSSARACADLLADLYRATKDWSLALSGYNGGFIWEYLKRAKGEGVSYENFLKFIENKLNLAKNEVKGMSGYSRIIKRGENLNAIAAKYGLKPAELAGFNGIGNLKNVKAGQKINIPLTEARREAIYNKKVSGFSENLNYPAKYYAIMELIKEGLVSEQEEPVIFETKDIRQAGPKYNFYMVKAEDKNLFRISKKFKVHHKELEKFNPAAVKNLKAGMEIKIPGGKSSRTTLADVARQTNKPVSRLKFLNPAIRENAPITINQIRV